MVEAEKTHRSAGQIVKYGGVGSSTSGVLSNSCCFVMRLTCPVTEIDKKYAGVKRSCEQDTYYQHTFPQRRTLSAAPLIAGKCTRIACVMADGFVR